MWLISDTITSISKSEPLPIEWKYLQKISVFVKNVVFLQKFRLFNNRMKLIYKSYKFRISPNKEQIILINNILVRHVSCLIVT